MNEEITPKKEINQKFKDNPALIAAAQAGDRRAADRLVRQNGGLVTHIAMRFIGRGCELEDLIQIGSMGLLKAIRTFDLTRGDFTSLGSTVGAAMTVHDSHLLFLLNGSTYETMGAISMNRQDRARMIGHLSAYYNIHIPKFPTLQSLDILQQLL